MCLVSLRCLVSLQHCFLVFNSYCGIVPCEQCCSGVFEFILGCFLWQGKFFGCFQNSLEHFNFFLIFQIVNFFVDLKYFVFHILHLGPYSCQCFMWIVMDVYSFSHASCLPIIKKKKKKVAKRCDSHDVFLSGYFCPDGTIYKEPAANFCPIGHYCPEGVSQALPCRNNSHVSCRICPTLNVNWYDGK